MFRAVCTSRYTPQNPCSAQKLGGNNFRANNLSDVDAFHFDFPLIYSPVYSQFLHGLRKIFYKRWNLKTWLYVSHPIYNPQISSAKSFEIHLEISEAIRHQAKGTVCEGGSVLGEEAYEKVPCIPVQFVSQQFDRRYSKLRSWKR